MYVAADVRVGPGKASISSLTARHGDATLEGQATFDWTDEDDPQATAGAKVRKLTIDEQAQVIAHACGAFGSSADYLERTRVSLATHGIVDPYLERLAGRVAARGCVAPMAIQEPHLAASTGEQPV